MAVALLSVVALTPSLKAGRFFAPSDSRRGGQGRKEEEGIGGVEGREGKGPNLRDSIRGESAAKASGENKGWLGSRVGWQEMKWE